MAILVGRFLDDIPDRVNAGVVDRGTLAVMDKSVTTIATRCRFFCWTVDRVSGYQDLRQRYLRTVKVSRIVAREEAIRIQSQLL